MYQYSNIYLLYFSGEFFRRTLPFSFSGEIYSLALNTCHLHIMTQKREIEDSSVDEEAGGKRQKIVEQPSDEDHGRNVSQGKQNRTIEVRRDCPFLDTVNRQVLDFDFEKKCSVSDRNLNVYACLICGKYYQGRGKNTHAYNHSHEAGHHVYINLQTEKVYCLPDGYEVKDSSLDDIPLVLNPRFTLEQVKQLDRKRQWSRALDGSDYLPGTVFNLPIYTPYICCFSYD